MDFLNKYKNINFNFSFDKFSFNKYNFEKKELMTKDNKRDNM